MPFPRNLQRLYCALALLSAAAVANAADITTAQYDAARTSWNSSEILLSAANVSSATFGKLFTRQLDGSVYAQPLYLQNLALQGHGAPNVVLVCTAANTVYLFDADNPAETAPYWSVNLGTADNTPNAPGSPNSEPSLGIISTPVIVRQTGTVYVVAATRESGHRVYRLHALDILSGRQRPNSPVVIQGEVPGTSADALNGLVRFDADFHLQRSSLAVAGRSVWLAMAGSRDTLPFHGWVFSYDLSTLSRTGIYNTTPNGMQGGIWQSMRAPVVDQSGSLYYETGNGDYDGALSYSNSVVRIVARPDGISLADWFTPDDWQSLSANDLDLSSSGPVMVPGTSILIAAGKNGTLYVIDTARMGHLQAGNGQIVQVLQAAPACTQVQCDFVNDLVFWNNASEPTLYLWPWNDVVRAYKWTGGRLSPSPSSSGNVPSDYPGGYMAGSSYGSTAGSGVLWALTGDNQDPQAATLRAFDARNVGTLLWSSGMNAARDSVGAFAKNLPPLVAGGKVFVGNFSNQLVIYGLLSGPVAGDVNADGRIDCADIAIVKASNNRKAGDALFDARADVVPDNLINVRDLAFVSQRLPRGVSCPN